MFLDLKKIAPEGLSFEHELRIPDLEGGAGDTVTVERCLLTGDVSKAKHGFALSARLDVAARVECGRCLEPFRTSIVRDFFLTLVPDAETARGKEYDEDEEATLFPCSEGRADLLEIAREQIYLNLPLKPICREGCKGLCPVCGANRNLTECDCKNVDVDPRLLPLLDFKNRPAT